MTESSCLDIETVRFSMFDDRMDHIQLAASAHMQGGSTTSILPLQNGYMLLAKKSFGSLSFVRHSEDVREERLHYGLGTCNHLLTQPILPCRCSPLSGVAVDPTQTFAISPFADSRRRGHFAVWSLINGSLLGSKSCKISNSNMVDCQSRISMPHW
jgi:hypothetical protein